MVEVVDGIDIDIGDAVAGAVAADGTKATIGVMNRPMVKRRATTTLVRPVRPPSSMPAALSIYVVTVEVPRRAPNVVPMASVSSILVRGFSGMLPFSSRSPTLADNPVTVPRVSKKSTMRKANITPIAPTLKRPTKSMCKAIGAMDAGRDRGEDGRENPAGYNWDAAPESRVAQITAIAVEPRMPQRRAPLILFTNSMMVMIRPMSAIATEGTLI